MNTLDYVLDRYNVRFVEDYPIQLPHTRGELAILLKDLNFNVGVEVGVDRGIYSEQLCKTNPNLKLYSIDPWKSYRRYEDIKDQNRLDKNYEHTKRLLDPYNCEIIKKSSMGAIKDFKPESIDFVYIDGNHSYDYVLEDVIGWSKIVKKNGIVAGHDYRSIRHELVGVSRAVDKYLKERNIKHLFRLSKNNDSSWFFVNETG